MKKTALILVCIILSACGQKGRLTLPTNAQSSANKIEMEQHGSL